MTIKAALGTLTTIVYVLVLGAPTKAQLEK